MSMIDRGAPVHYLRWYSGTAVMCTATATAYSVRLRAATTFRRSCVHVRVYNCNLEFRTRCTRALPSTFDLIDVSCLVSLVSRNRKLPVSRCPRLLSEAEPSHSSVSPYSNSHLSGSGLRLVSGTPRHQRLAPRLASTRPIVRSTHAHAHCPHSSRCATALSLQLGGTCFSTANLPSRQPCKSR